MSKRVRYSGGTYQIKAAAAPDEDSNSSSGQLDEFWEAIKSSVENQSEGENTPKHTPVVLAAPPVLVTPSKRVRSAEHRGVPRPPQPAPLPPWTPVDGHKRFLYDFGMSRVVEVVGRTEPNAEGETYSYVHIVGQDGRMDHWAPTRQLEELGEDSLSSNDLKLRTRPSIRMVDHLVFGEHIIPTWYPSAFPTELQPDLMANGGRLFMCPVCLKYTTDPKKYARHRKPEVGNCSGDRMLKGLWHPPGCEIYSHQDGWSVWEVDGGDADADVPDDDTMSWEHSSTVGPQKGTGPRAIEAAHRDRFCHSLCLVARLFLDTKLNRFGMAPFRFYILTEKDSVGRHCIRGYYSREKGHHRNNLSCIVMLPPWQRSGWGRRLIHLSYLLSRTEGQFGTPERPLSALGRKVYETFGREQIIDYLTHTLHTKPGSRPTVPDIMAATSMDRDDVLQVLRSLSLLPTPTSTTLDWGAFSKLSVTRSSSYGFKADPNLLYHISCDYAIADASKRQTLTF